MLKKIFFLFLICLRLVSALLPSTAFCDAAGYPAILNPIISVTLSLSKTEVKVGDLITMDYYIKNESKKTLYICDVGFISYDDIYEEKHWVSIEFDGAVVEPGKTIKLSEEYKTEPCFFSLKNGDVNCHIWPRIEYCYYTEEVKQGELPKWYGLFEYDSKTKIIISAIPPYDFSPELDIEYTVEKRSEEDTYDFYVTVTNNSDETIDNMWIDSSIGRLEPAESNNEAPKSLKPKEILRLHLIYDFYKNYEPANYNQPVGNKLVALYVCGYLFNSEERVYEISNNLQSLIFPKYELQLEAEILCDVKQAYYNEAIPYTLILHNPTDKIYKDIEIRGYDKAFDISPDETIYIDDTTKEWFVLYGLNIFNGFNVGTTINANVDLLYNDNYYYFNDWCINYDEIEFPEVEITMPPQAKNLITKVETCNSTEYTIYYINYNGENIEVDYIGCVENGYIKDYAEIMLLDGQGESFLFSPGTYSYALDNEGNKSLELLIVGYGEETDNMYWLHDTFPIAQVKSYSTQEPTPPPTQEPTGAPASTPKPTTSPIEGVSAKIDLIDIYETGSKDLTVKFVITNNYSESLCNIRIMDIDGNVIYRLHELDGYDTFAYDFVLPYGEEIYLDVKYKIDAETKSVRTNTLINLISDIDNHSKSGKGEIKSIYKILAIILFVGLSAVGIVIIRKRKEDKSLYK